MFQKLITMTLKMARRETAKKEFAEILASAEEEALVEAEKNLSVEMALVEEEDLVLEALEALRPEVVMPPGEERLFWLRIGK